MPLSKLINIGVKPDMEYYQKREVRMVNMFGWIAFIGSIIGISIVQIVNAKYPTHIANISVFTGLAVLLFNYKGYYNLASYFFVITVNISVFIIVQQYDDNVGNYLYYFPLIFCVALIHNPLKYKNRTLVFFTMIAVSFLCAWFFDIESLKNTSITPQDNKVLLVYNTCFTFFLTILLVYFVIKFLNRQNEETLSLLKQQQESEKIISISLKEKEVLLAEIHHRVKNNLAIITGLLNLQTEKAPCDISKNMMIDSKNRVMSISMVHERLYKIDNLSKINFKTYLSELVNELVKSYQTFNKIQIVEELDSIEIELTTAVPVGLIVNELMTNSLKHAFPESIKSPIVRIQLKKIFDSIQISVSDNGIGFGDIDKREDTSLGIILIESLADQIDAKVAFRNENGATVNIVFLA